MTEYIVNADEENSLMYGRKYEELIRCKDCKWYITNYMKDFPDGFNRMDGLAECQNLLGADDVTEDDYCCKAERWEE